MDTFLEVLWDSEFNVDDYKHLGENDGMLQEMSSMAHKLGMPEEAKKAYAAVYNMD